MKLFAYLPLFVTNFATKIATKCHYTSVSEILCCENRLPLVYTQQKLLDDRAEALVKDDKATLETLTTEIKKSIGRDKWRAKLEY